MANRKKRLRTAATLDKSPYEQDEHRTDDGTDEAGSLASLIPANSLAEIGGYQGADHSKDRGENKALRLVFTARRNQFRDYSSNEANDYGPEKAQPPSDCCRRQLAPFYEPLRERKEAASGVELRPLAQRSALLMTALRYGIIARPLQTLASIRAKG